MNDLSGGSAAVLMVLYRGQTRFGTQTLFKVKKLNLLDTVMLMQCCYESSTYLPTVILTLS